MDRQSARNALRLFNLRESPFFQEPLQLDGHYPLSLFVGREEDSNTLLKKIDRSPAGSRQTIRGPVGVGKSTLAQHIKAEVAGDGILSSPGSASLGSASTTDQLCALILRSALDALLGVPSLTEKQMQTLVGEPAVQQASQLVRIYQTTTGTGGGLGVAGFSASSSHSITLVTPATATPSLVANEVLRELMYVARTRLEAQGILIHLNNLENLTEADATRAAAVLRDIRDIALTVDGYHWLVVGIDEAVRTVIDIQPQLKMFNTPPALAPLREEEVLQLLDRRYYALRYDETQPVHPPIEEDAVVALYQIFVGDLRGTFAALDAVMGEILGAGSGGPNAPLTLSDMAPFLTGWYEERAIANVGVAVARHIPAMVFTFGLEPFSQTTLKTDVLHLKNNVVTKRVVDTLLAYGYIAEHQERLHRGGRPAVQYVMTGPARLAAGMARG
jgi:hypothetical protein